MICERIPLHPLTMMVVDSPWDSHEEIPLSRKMTNMRDYFWSDEDELVMRPSRIMRRFCPFGNRNILRSSFAFPDGFTARRRLNSENRTTEDHKESKDNSKEGNKSNNEVSQKPSYNINLSDANSDVSEAWQFEVDLRGCDQVRTFTENGFLTVEGSGENEGSKVMIRQVISLPKDVDPSTLEAKRTKGNKLVVSHIRPRSQVESRRNIDIVMSEEVNQSNGDRRSQNGDRSQNDDGNIQNGDRRSQNDGKSQNGDSKKLEKKDMHQEPNNHLDDED